MRTVEDACPYGFVNILMRTLLSGAFFLFDRRDENPPSEANLNFKLSQSFRRGWRFALAKLHALAPVRSLRAQFKFPPVPPNATQTNTYFFSGGFAVKVSL